ncbi:TPA: helix-turn-helix domain-containing protein [Streptococcus pyogenes]|nr:helix-turn-helix domain-containing protein [Streptococcus pyogenes]HEQ8809880.1 helix-turn-helix domain-containing protein [Streptococcus pyogenes]HEQ8838426.1 helix-turn-helix domain-containing protein [Streptococcus pyogenes]HEQ9429020.1 helix-turn-helix domain-containing protein [Streptococcus pyogenes]HEQ9516255.1 helix-turn-helix domain-containing protein [Streptococcus pyogenes]
MLHLHLETKLQDKLSLLNILLDVSEVSIDQLCQETELKKQRVYNLLFEMIKDLEDTLTLTICDDTVSIPYKTYQLKMPYFKKLYQTSIFLKMLCFLIEPGELSLHDFIKREYISQATAYRIRTNCRKYLKKVGLNVRQNHVVGPEYRIRFLIALLHYQFGMTIYDFDKTSMNKVVSLIINSNQAITLNDASKAPYEFSYFAILISLIWKRRHDNLEIPQTDAFKHLKKLSIYHDIKMTSQEIIGKWYHPDLTDEDLDYIFLCFCTTNNPFHKDKWTPKKVKELFELVMTKTIGKTLKASLRPLLGDNILNSLPFKRILVSFSRLFISNLQVLLPDIHLFHYLRRQQKRNKSFYNTLKTIVEEWMSAEGIVGKLPSYHLLLFTIQLEELLKTYLPPIPVYLLTNNTAALDLMTNALSIYFPPAIATVMPVNVEIIPFKDIVKEKQSVIIADRQYLNLIQHLYQNQGHLFLYFLFSFRDVSEAYIHKVFLDFRQKRYDEFIVTLLDTYHKNLSSP